MGPVDRPGDVLTVLVDALSGAKRALSTGKYAGIEPRTPTQHVAALLRHIGRYMVDTYGSDDESGLSHIDHILARAALLAFENTREAIDMAPEAP